MLQRLFVVGVLGSAALWGGGCSLGHGPDSEPPPPGARRVTVDVSGMH